MTTQRQIEANRRNAQKSTGPRTAEGKDRSRFNGVTHGMNAKFDVLPGEDGAALTGRIDAWTNDFQPRNQLERNLVERAARLSWKLERVERAHVDRLTANILKATSGESEAVEQAVLTLGERLFQDLTKPHGFSPDIAVDPNNPTMLVLHLESSALGCRWLLDRWADLRSLLEQEQPWQSHDKLRAIRLLGRQPLDALDDSEVAKVFLACHTIDSSGGELLHEIWNELGPHELDVARQRFAGRPLEWLPLHDRTEAREALALLRIDCVIVIPTAPDDEVGHADEVLSFLDEETVVVNAYSEVAPAYRNRLLAKPRRSGMDWVEVPYLPKDGRPGEIPSAFDYVNYLRVRSPVILPIYGLPEVELARMVLADRLPGSDKLTLDYTVLPREGGVLNCATWTIAM